MKLPRLEIAFLRHPKDKPRAVVTKNFTSIDNNFIPRGFVFDGSTKLSMLWGLVHIGLGSYGEQNEPSVEHDWIYVHDGKLPDGKVYSRKECDKLFRKMLLKYGIRPIRAWIAYTVIRSKGKKYWDRGNGKPEILSEQQLKNLGL